MRKRSEAVFVCVSIYVPAQFAMDIVKYNLGAFLQLTLPDCNYTPAKIPQFLSLTLIPLHRDIKFRLPKLCPGSRSSSIRTTWMPVPITAMDKYNCAVFPKNYVRATWQFLIVEAETVTSTMKQ